MVKALDAPYDAGRRGGAWRKIKPVHTLDLVVLAAEWGHGRRTGWLSNLHLGARGDDGAFVMVGKTFKGLTDELLRWQTEALQAIAVGTEDGLHRPRPARARRRDRPRRRAGVDALPGRRRPALRPRPPLPPRQDGRRRRPHHDRPGDAALTRVAGGQASKRGRRPDVVGAGEDELDGRAPRRRPGAARSTRRCRAATPRSRRSCRRRTCVRQKYDTSSGAPTMATTITGVAVDVGDRHRADRRAAIGEVQRRQRRRRPARRRHG